MKGGATHWGADTSLLLLTVTLIVNESDEDSRFGVSVSNMRLNQPYATEAEKAKDK